MITEVRDYFKAVIKTIDSDLKYDGKVGDEEEVGQTALDRTYKIVFGQLLPENIDSTIEATLPVTVKMYTTLRIEEVEDYDKAYCKAIDVHALAQDKRQIDQTQGLKSVECESILPEPIETNDKVYRFTLQFTVKLAYKYTG